MQKRAKNVHLKYSFIKKRAKRAKTCIPSIFGPNSKTCIFKVRAAWGRAAQGLTVLWKKIVLVLEKFKAEGREIAKFLKSLKNLFKQFPNFCWVWWHIFFFSIKLLYTRKTLNLNMLTQKMQRKCRKKGLKKLDRTYFLNQPYKSRIEKAYLP